MLGCLRPGLRRLCVAAANMSCELPAGGAAFLPALRGLTRQERSKGGQGGGRGRLCQGRARAAWRQRAFAIGHWPALSSLHPPQQAVPSIKAPMPPAHAPGFQQMPGGAAGRLVAPGCWPVLSLKACVLSPPRPPPALPPCSLDLDNCLEEVPAGLSRLTGLQELLISRDELSYTGFEVGTTRAGRVRHGTAWAIQYWVLHELASPEVVVCPRVPAPASHITPLRCWGPCCTDGWVGQQRRAVAIRLLRCPGLPSARVRPLVALLQVAVELGEGRACSPLAHAEICLMHVLYTSFVVVRSVCCRCRPSWAS